MKFHWKFILIVIFTESLILGQETEDSELKPLSSKVPLRINHPCTNSSCFPASGNLMIGRESQLSASSTCGSIAPQRYCVASNSGDNKRCFICDTRPETRQNPNLNHDVSKIVTKMHPGTRRHSWWQSENGVENVTLQLNFEAEFYLSHVIITFKTIRPAAMFIEKSLDHGRTWRVYRYFAENCEKSFPGVPKLSSKTSTGVVCDSRYSSIEPSTNGEVIFIVLPWSMKVTEPYSNEIQDLMKMTNFRLSFTKLHTLGDSLSSDSVGVKEMYYYAISEMILRGSCLCYGHASVCSPLLGKEPKTNMVHARCECTHNTKNLNCEYCEDLYNDLPWKPTLGNATNTCKRCNCNDHSNSCHFDSVLYESTGRVSGGVCDDCKHNTYGKNCELCLPFYYRDVSLDLNHSKICRACDCDPRGSLDDGLCDPLTDSDTDQESGRCHCKINVEGRRCNRCKDGFSNLDEGDPDGCQADDCDPKGTLENDIFNPVTTGGLKDGQCRCKANVDGPRCNRCKKGFWNLEDSNSNGCQNCPCNPFGAAGCNVHTGKCICKKNVIGEECNILIFSFGND